MEDLNKFKVPELKGALAWLWNRSLADRVVNKKVKADLIESIIIAIEGLLSDLCKLCKSEYSIGREETPALGSSTSEEVAPGSIGKKQMGS